MRQRICSLLIRLPILVLILMLGFLREVKGQFNVPVTNEKAYILSGPQRWEGTVNKLVSLSCEVFIPKSTLQDVPELQWMYSAPGQDKFYEVKQSANRNNRVTIFTSSYNDATQTKKSRLEFQRVQTGNAGEYKCTIGGGITYGGAESEVALIRISEYI
ncbi:uncharacterized protein LOC142349919 [Convolutriloba macropyga]|uniref:uncharacterized protein LOC142349919 n=1 Tax=Convolutriloba macropyga TaxID=536237 RepID=UPI003F522EDC